MADEFKVGEIAILQNCFNPAYNGQECTVESLPSKNDQINPHTGRRILAGRYLISARLNDSGDDFWQVEPHGLRKKKPPRDDLQVVRWSDVPWWPEALVKEQSHV